MAKTSVRKEKWTLSFDPTLKRLVTQAAKRKGVYPVTLLEELVRERFNPYGLSEVKDSRAYVTALRKQARRQSDKEFLADLHAWQKSPSA
ncbi:MAG: hypothetical protein WD425_15305 [Nitrospirales bacterium]